MDKYEIGEQIGKGGYSLVYKATDKETGKEYALKIVKKRDYKFNDTIRKEIDLHSKLDHPNIIKLIHSSEDDEKFYILLELCGENSYMYVKNNKGIIQGEALDIIYQISLAVKYLHDNYITHRDIKMENIVKCGSLWKLVDFGFASYERTFTDTTGTLDYLAPEIVNGKDYKGFPVDIWTLGITLYDLLYFRPPFFEKGRNETFKAILNNKPSFEARNISALTKNLIESMLIKNPEKRIDIDQVLEMLKPSSSTSIPSTIGSKPIKNKLPPLLKSKSVIMTKSKLPPLKKSEK